MKTIQLYAANKMSLQMHVLKGCLYFTNLAAIVIYILLRLVFSDYSIRFKEDAANLAQTILIATGLAAGLYLVYIAAITLHKAWQSRNTIKLTSASIGMNTPVFGFAKKIA